MSELISVIIPCYNRKEQISESLESVLRQSYENIEVIVVDDGSTDGTEEMFADYPDMRVRYLRYTPNRGACYARNYGAERAGGDIIAFQDSDDIWHEDKLEKQYVHLCETGADMVFCGMNRVSTDGSAYYFPVHSFGPAHATEQLLAENRVGTQNILMKKSAWKDVRFDEDFRRYQDWDFAIRVSLKHSMAYLPEALTESPVNGDSISATVNSYPALKKLYDKHLELYNKYPNSDCVMNRRMGKRLFKSDPSLAAQHYKKSYKLCHKWYDLSWYIAAAIKKKRQTGR